MRDFVAQIKVSAPTEKRSMSLREHVASGSTDSGIKFSVSKPLGSLDLTITVGGKDWTLMVSDAFSSILDSITSNP